LEGTQPILLAAVNEVEHEDLGVSELMFEARMGGSILERMTDGRVLPWADVLAWQPPQRFVLSWLTALLTRTAHRARGDFCCARRRHVDRGRASRMGAVVGGVPHGLYELYERGWPFTLECFVAETTETADGHRQGHSVSCLLAQKEEFLSVGSFLDELSGSVELRCRRRILWEPTTISGSDHI